MLIVKQYIYRKRCLKEALNVIEIPNEIERVEQLEFYIAKNKGKIFKHNKKWSAIGYDRPVFDDISEY